jgi:serine protease Do
MKVVKVVSVLVFIAGVAALLSLAAPDVYGQRSDRPDARAFDLWPLIGSGSTIGVSVKDVDTQTDRQRAQAGAIIDDVRADSPADKAGLKRSDIVVEFDGERVRSARHFTRLVEETPPGRTVKATILRDGQRKDIQITPIDDRRAEAFIDGPRLRAELDNLRRELPRLNFDFDFAGGSSRSRLGVVVTELSPQLAAYFGAKDGVLVSSVTDDSPAARAGVKAGDVITSANGQQVRSRQELVQALRSVEGGDVTIGIVRDKREITLKAKIEPARRAPREGRPA